MSRDEQKGSVQATQESAQKQQNSKQRNRIKKRTKSNVNIVTNHENESNKQDKNFSPLVKHDRRPNDIRTTLSISNKGDDMYDAKLDNISEKTDEEQ